jgi:hypothetical protein
VKITPTLQWHEKSCYVCRYYRQMRENGFSDCLLLGRSLSQTNDPAHDRARVCEGWKRRPKTWVHYVDENPFWNDPYISRESQIRTRKRLGILT